MEAAHVFVSPVNGKLFNEIFTPYPSEKENRCSNYIDKLFNYLKIELLESSIRGVYVFKVIIK